MDTDRKFIDAVLTVLEIGADGRYTGEQLDAKLKARGLDVQGVHVRGAKGLFESSHDGHLRLNLAGLNLLMTHRSIEQAKRHACNAMWIASLAVILTLAAPVWTIISDSAATRPNRPTAPAVDSSQSADTATSRIITNR